MDRLNLSRILYYDRLYQKIVGVPGVILELGVQWGSTLSLFTNLRGIYEPYNHSRRIIGFDTFAGFPSVSEHDGDASRVGDYSVRAGHEQLLDEILSIQGALNPVPHISKHQLVRGDLRETLPRWLDDNPHAIVSMVIFDVDLYEPTFIGLEAIIPRLTKGSLLVFDELNAEAFPGETRALDASVGLQNLRLQHDPHQPNCAWAVWGD
jgi:hypothetical protein